MGIVMGGIDLPDNPAPTAKLFQRQGVEGKKLERGEMQSTGDKRFNTQHDPFTHLPYH